MIEGLVIRELDASDSIEELTDLLHRAYAPLGEMGLNFTAVDQSVDVTRRRVSHGVCFVAVMDGRLVGTVTVALPSPTSPCDYYRTDGVAAAHQFGVEPELQSSGIGSRLLSHAEAWAREHGNCELAVDTAEPATHLVEYYTRRGFQPVSRTQWYGKKYESIVFSKSLNES